LDEKQRVAKKNVSFSEESANGEQSGESVQHQPNKKISSKEEENEFRKEFNPSRKKRIAQLCPKKKDCSPKQKNKLGKDSNPCRKKKESFATPPEEKYFSPTTTTPTNKIATTKKAIRTKKDFQSHENKIGFGHFEKGSMNVGQKGPEAKPPFLQKKRREKKKKKRARVRQRRMRRRRRRKMTRNNRKRRKLRSV